MDPELEEIKRMLQKNVALAEDTNHIVHKLRRNIWWGRLWTIVWWVAILAVSGAAYYVYLQPYVDQLSQAYGNVQGWQVQVQDFFAKFGQSGTTTN